MFSISSFGSKLLAKLRRKPYRDAYVSEHVRRGIAAQIRALRDQRGWNQGKLSDLLGKPQSVVSRLEDPGYGKVTVQTLLEIASAYDIALQVRFVSYSTFLQQTRTLTGASMQVPSFQDDLAAKAASEIMLRFNDEHTSGRIALVETTSTDQNDRESEDDVLELRVVTGISGVSAEMKGFSLQ